MINDKIIPNSKIITNTDNEFKLHYTEDDGSSYELIIQAPHTIISTWHTPDGEIYMYHKEVNGMLGMS